MILPMLMLNIMTMLTQIITSIPRKFTLNHSQTTLLPQITLAPAQAQASPAPIITLRLSLLPPTTQNPLLLMSKWGRMMKTLMIKLTTSPSMKQTLTLMSPASWTYLILIQSRVSFQLRMKLKLMIPLSSSVNEKGTPMLDHLLS